MLRCYSAGVTGHLSRSARLLLNLKCSPSWRRMPSETGKSRPARVAMKPQRSAVAAPCQAAESALIVT
jgi:hypothetical protein